MRVKIFDIIPTAKPRMTRKDKIPAFQSDAVKKYWAYKDELLRQAEGFVPPVAGSHILYYLPIPASLSDRKKEALIKLPHQVKPDLDNLAKGTFDAFFRNDSCVWDV